MPALGYILLETILWICLWNAQNTKLYIMYVKVEIVILLQICLVFWDFGLTPQPSQFSVYPHNLLLKFWFWLTSDPPSCPQAPRTSQNFQFLSFQWRGIFAGFIRILAPVMAEYSMIDCPWYYEWNCLLLIEFVNP